MINQIADTLPSEIQTLDISRTPKGTIQKYWFTALLVYHAHPLYVFII